MKPVDELLARRGDGSACVIHLLGIEGGVCTCGPTHFGMPLKGCGHPVEYKWLTRRMVSCACGLSLNRESFASVAKPVEQRFPKVHCGRWHLRLDDRTRHHSTRCFQKKRPSLRLVSREDGSTK